MAALEFRILQKTRKKAKKEFWRRIVSKFELNNSAKNLLAQKIRQVFLSYSGCYSYFVF